MLQKLILIGLSLILSLSCAAFAQENTVERKQWVRHFYGEVLNKGKLGLLDGLVADNYQEHEPLPGFQSNKTGLKQYFAMMRKAFPDLHNNIEFTVIDGDKVVSYITMTGTHRGEFMGMPGTGKSFNIKVIDIIKVTDGKMSEHWGVGDWMTMMEQLGSKAQ